MARRNPQRALEETGQGFAVTRGGIRHRSLPGHLRIPLDQLSDEFVS
jgi:hypothetical protein